MEEREEELIVAQMVERRIEDTSNSDNPTAIR